MKRIYSSCILLLMVLGIGFSANAELSVNLSWNEPGAVVVRVGSNSADPQPIPATATSYKATIDATWGSCYVFPADGYYLEGGVAADGTELKPVGYGSGPKYLSINMSEYNGSTITITATKIVRDTPFTINLVNGLSSIINAEFTSGYTLDLKEGSATYYFNPAVDGTLDVRFAGKVAPYIITLNGAEPVTDATKGKLVKYNTVLPYYDVTLAKDDVLKIQMFESSDQELKKFNLTINYGEGMEGCVSSIFNRATSKLYTAGNYENGLITGLQDVLQGSEIRINMGNEDFTITEVLLNGVNMTKNLVSSDNGIDQTFEFVMNENTTITLNGQATEWGDVTYTGYVSDPEGVAFGLSYGTNPAEYTLQPTIGADCGGKTVKLADDTQVVMPEGSKTIKLSVTEKNRGGQFFFMPKRGYYIKNFICGSPLEQGSGSASMSPNLDGTVFYMIVEKLPEAYTANLSVTGNDFFMRISANSSLADVWGNPGVGGYAANEGESEISFIPGYGTPLVFGFSGDETKTPAVYLDGAEVAGVLNEESNAQEYTIEPYYPQAAGDPTDIHSSIVVYNSINERPQLSGASLKLEDGGQAEFFYSPVLHKANPEGQVVISGTQFTVRPKSADMTVLYKGKLVELDANGEYVFNATGNARNNIVTVTTKKESGVASVDDNEPATVTVYSIDGKTLLENAPASRLGELEEGLYIVNGKKVRTSK